MFLKEIDTSTQTKQGRHRSWLDDHERTDWWTDGTTDGQGEVQRDTVASSRPNFDSIHTVSRKLQKTLRSLLLRKSQTEQISKVKRMSESRTKREKEIEKA